MTGHEVIIEFELKDEKITNNTDRIIEAFEEIKSSFSGNVDKPISEGLAEMADKSQKAAKPLKELKKGVKGTALAIGVLATKSAIFAKKAIQLAQGSAEFIGTQTKFNAIFDRTNGELEQAQKWVDNYSKSLMLDNKVVMDTVSNFKLFANTLGLSNEKAKEITFNMTQLAHDMAAVAGVDVSSMAQRINSALAGQTKALKEYGISLDSNSLQQTLYQNNIKRTVASLNSAEKAELIYTQIMKQTAGQQGYLAKTMLSPANAANIVKTQFTLLGRSIGNLVLPILMKLLPVVVAVTQALTRMAEALAAFFGIKINFSDYGADIGGISAGIDGIGESADGTSKKIKNMLRDFDDLHVVDFGDDSGSGGGIGGGIGGGGLGLEAQQYADWSKYLDDINGKLSISEGWVKAIVGGLAGLTVGKIVGKILELTGALEGANVIAFTLGTTLAGIGIGITFDATKNILMNGLNSKNIIETIMGALTTGGGAALVAKSLGANPALALKIGLLVTIGMVSFNIGVGIGEWLKKKLNLPEKFEHYIKEFNLDVNEDSIFEQAVKIVAILYNSIKDALVEKFPILELFGMNTGKKISQGVKKGISAEGKFIPKTLDTIMTDAEKNVSRALIKTETQVSTSTKNMYDSFNSSFSNISTTMKNGALDAEQNFSKISNSADTYFKNTRFNIEGGITGAERTVKTSVAGIKTNMNLAYGSIQTGSMNMKNDLDSNLNGARNSFSNLSSDAKKYSDEVKKNLASISNAKVKTPKFSWSLATKAVGTIAKVLSALSLPTSLPKLNVSWYADGGFPDKGDLFIANEREPELIGTMGNKTTVANGMQIIEGIAQASYNGMKRALQEIDFGGGDTLVYVGNKQLTDVVTKQQRMNNKKYGR